MSMRLAAIIGLVPFTLLGTSPVVSNADVPAKPIDTTIKDVISGRLPGARVRLSAVIQDAFSDEIDPHFVFLVLTDKGETMYATHCDQRFDIAELTELLHAKVQLTGRVDQTMPATWNAHGIIRCLGWCVNFRERSDLTVLSKPGSPYDVPDLEDLVGKVPTEVFNAGRRKVKGNVLAVWQNNVLLRTDRGLISRLSLADVPTPAVGETIEAVGHPATDLFNVNLLRAVWRPTSVGVRQEPPATNVTAAALMYDANGRLCYKPATQGRLVTMSGTVTEVGIGPGHVGTVKMKSDGEVIPVDASARPELLRGITEGCRIAVTGVCVLQIDDWRPNDAIPHIRGFTLVPRTSEDIVLLARPPWWTIQHLIWALAVVCAILVLSSVGNVILREVIKRREVELEAEIMARVESDLKIRERTRLAIELHDSVSQNLTGVALELQTVARSGGPFPPDVQHHMDIAKRALGSCRDELRRCLWDLRNDMLEEPDVETAIRRTLTPHLANARLAVRFAVPRDRFSDNTMHTILRATRELATNAIRHGKASSIRIAGSIEGDRLRLSVTDNGTGFDPRHCPGVGEGHYGLLGIAERFSSLGGTFDISSKPGHTRATCTLPLHEIKST